LPLRAAEPESILSTGPETLAKLAAQSGGRVFHDHDSDAGIYNDLRIIDGNLRNQYRLVYKPAELKPDGSFHPIELKAPRRLDSITIRAGYYEWDPAYAQLDKPEGQTYSAGDYLSHVGWQEGEALSAHHAIDRIAQQLRS
jgi:hypothetical protein